VHDPQTDYYCYYCDTRKLYCAYCLEARTATARNSYYSSYYVGYYARYYANYYREYFLHVNEEDAVLAKEARLQQLTEAQWNERTHLVLEQPDFEYAEENRKYNHRTPPEGIVQFGPAGGVGDAWTG
jgi:hypothetical protein